ncbi:S-adenosyl-L-methionine-dependent methyltransferase [Syncephalis plumigaleata]|nr:S-adenosyl-L-methionine-dependent methyltransferase [Syncephalis plumigaleata]
MSCCPSKSTCCPPPAKEAAVHDVVKDYYGKVLSSSKDLKTSACTTCTPPPDVVRDAFKLIPSPVLDKFYGCGSPLPVGINGLTVLDLGSGSGRDCYVAAKLVGPTGRVIGIDMTEEQLDVARAHIDEFATRLGWKPDLTFKHGYIERIEDAGIAANSIDIILSNCVVNLSPDKPAVLKGAYQALRNGGEFYFSDVYADRLGECIGGALYTEDFLRICKQEPVAVEDEALASIVGDAKFYSITYRLFKVDGLEDKEDEEGEGHEYVATYLGSISDSPDAYVLDKNVKLTANQPISVSSNVARILQSGWLHDHFRVSTNDAMTSSAN